MTSQTVWPLRWRQCSSPRFLELSDPSDEDTIEVNDFLKYLTVKIKALQQSKTSWTGWLWRWRHYNSRTLLALFDSEDEGTIPVPWLLELSDDEEEGTTPVQEFDNIPQSFNLQQHCCENLKYMVWKHKQKITVLVISLCYYLSMSNLWMLCHK